MLAASDMETMYRATGSSDNRTGAARRPNDDFKAFALLALAQGVVCEIVAIIKPID